MEDLPSMWGQAVETAAEAGRTGAGAGARTWSGAGVGSRTGAGIETRTEAGAGAGARTPTGTGTGPGVGAGTKPCCSYVALIAEALLAAPSGRLLLGDIYRYIAAHYPYYSETADRSWRNSVRHNLSLNDCFVKSGRSTSVKGHYWSVHPACLQAFAAGDYRGRRARRRARPHRGETATSGRGVSGKWGSDRTPLGGLAGGNMEERGCYSSGGKLVEKGACSESGWLKAGYTKAGCEEAELMWAWRRETWRREAGFVPMTLCGTPFRECLRREGADAVWGRLERSLASSGPRPGSTRDHSLRAEEMQAVLFDSVFAKNTRLEVEVGLGDDSNAGTMLGGNACAADHVKSWETFESLPLNSPSLYSQLSDVRAGHWRAGVLEDVDDDTCAGGAGGSYTEYLLDSGAGAACWLRWLTRDSPLMQCLPPAAAGQLGSYEHNQAAILT